ncbi:hypothetical protein EHEL_041540 [Encephalitozoon hellem ATCC 50504]|uniref:Ap-2 complex subunit sigma-1 n=1 Tax=Encephalitozoon hellem TaxID=27973 RepID=A0A9Q9C2S0_ENCHE|nr:uncharacterized protein EHEL_041540 [Encephalitozoon hellem ATCC 50504]AFM98202.1 hypothetical protein EHEL_041540 [Encephalitozoon hellem ATCC 50504]UTX43051.1 hypothetical protein GPU96_04g07860 [Encephalitozoon hellem]WEL38508.1 ap-2 complex subunit sigma-1 [Encephalitozoon hellem]|eukprot:XP_003887183.1 hypothetical protein EHEL_041540 [Encephalitozoon hellem ATCC 50504]
MEKKLPTVVTIGGRRYVKNNLNKGTGDGKIRLKEALKSLGRTVQKSQISHCTINTKESIHVYTLDDSKVILNKNNDLVGFIVTGKAQKINKSVCQELSNAMGDNAKAPENDTVEEKLKH